MSGSLSVVALVGPNAVSIQSGSILYEKIYDAVRRDGEVVVDFAGVKVFATPFFNASFGLLVKDLGVDKLASQVQIANIIPLGDELVREVIENAVEFYGLKKDG